jgi:Transposase IS4
MILPIHREGEPKMKMSETCKKLVEPYYNTGRNVTTDRGYTDVELATSLQLNGLSLVGTVMLNKADIPVEIKTANGRQLNSSLFLYDADGKGVTTVSWCKSLKPPRVVVLVSTMHTNNCVVPEKFFKIFSGRTKRLVLNKLGKPEILLCYNELKGGVDTIDMMVRELSIKRPSNRWTMSMFFSIIDISMVNAYTSFILANPNWKAKCSNRRQLFHLELGEQLCKPLMIRRAANPVGLQLNITQPLKKLLKQATLGFSSRPLIPKRSARTLVRAFSSSCFCE